MDDVAFVALGSNLGDRHAHLAAARLRLAAIPATIVIASTAAQETAPIGPIVQGPFLNQMVALKTSLTPAELLEHLHVIEMAGGRVRGTRWGPRTIDLDIVKYAATEWNSTDLRVPHPEIENREFWQRELSELEGRIR